MSWIIKFCPVWMVLPFQLLAGLVQWKKKSYNRKMLAQCNCKSIGMKALAACGGKYHEFIKEYACCRIVVEKQGNAPEDQENPVVICIVKNDLVRMKLFMKHYRQLGIKQFAVLDDASEDGTKEYLMEQPDVTVLRTNRDYTTLRRQVWITRIVEIMGRNRWFLIVDSDELFDYKDSRSISLKQLAQKLTTKKITRVKALLLDMFSKDSLYSNKIQNSSDIPKICNLFLSSYTLEKTLYDVRIRGGARDVLFQGLQSSPLVSKYPLIYVDEKDILLNSHYNYPFVRNKPRRPSAVLRHYKFLPGDQEKYEVRIKKGNFYNNSKDYKAYLSLINKEAYCKIADIMTVYDDFSSLAVISIMEVK